jgi:hypothetical protein
MDQLPSCQSEDLTYQALSSEGRLKNIDDISSTISLSELNGFRQNPPEPRTKRRNEDPGFMNKMCNVICCCFTCFDRPQGDKTEYKNVPNPEANSRKRELKQTEKM